MSDNLPIDVKPIYRPPAIIPNFSEIELTYKGQAAFPISREMAEKVARILNQVDGSSNTLFMDEMIINDEYNGIAKMNLIMKQISSIDDALKKNDFKRRQAELKLYWFKKLYLICPLTTIKLRIEEWELEFEDTKKYLTKALIRKENFQNHYRALEAKYGELDLKKLEDEEPKSQVMRLFGQAIWDTLERGQPSRGNYSFANQHNFITEAELYKEIRDFCFMEGEQPNELRIRPVSLEDKEYFLEIMGRKYGNRQRDRRFLANGTH